MAKRAKENALDATKEMDQLLKYAKVVSIRDLQKKEHIKMEKDFKDKENKKKGKKKKKKKEEEKRRKKEKKKRKEKEKKKKRKKRKKKKEK